VASTPARSTMRAKPAVVNGDPRSLVNRNGDLGSCSSAAIAEAITEQGGGFRLSNLCCALSGQRSGAWQFSTDFTQRRPGASGRAHRDVQLEAHRIENVKNSREVGFFGSPSNAR